MLQTCTSLISYIKRDLLKVPDCYTTFKTRAVSLTFLQIFQLKALSMWLSVQRWWRVFCIFILAFMFARLLTHL